MKKDQLSPRIPAPCIIDCGTIVNKEDMKRLLSDLAKVRYIHLLDGKVKSEGEGLVLEIFADPCQSTLIANHHIYINIESFDYLQVNQFSPTETCFTLIQDNRQLKLIPRSNYLQEQEAIKNIDAGTLEAMVTQVLSAKWDVQMDDDSSFSS